jgi:hypothetical protein
MGYDMRNISSSYVSNLLTGKNCMRARFIMGLSALGDHVGHVSIMVVKVKMVGVNAVSNIAFMANKLARNCSVMNFVRNRMGAARLPVKPAISIAAWNTVASPNPARPKLRLYNWPVSVNSLPEPNYVLRLAVIIKAWLRTVNTRSALPRVKWMFTVSAMACYFLSRQDVFSPDENAWSLGSPTASTVYGPFLFYHQTV